MDSSERRGMLCIGQTILILLSHVVVECYLLGYANIARYIRLYYVATMYEISIRNAILPFARELTSVPVFLCSNSIHNQSNLSDI